MSTEHIPNEDDLYRRIIPDWYDRTKGKISSAAFSNEECSVDWSKYRSNQNECLKGYPSTSLAAIKAKYPRKEKLEVNHTPESNNYSHSSIMGKKTKGKRKFLRDNCTLIINNFT